MTDQWWFPLAAGAVVVAGFVLLAAAGNFLMSRLSAEKRLALGGAMIIAFAVCVIGAAVYAVILAPAVDGPHVEGREYVR